jgi:hypothetical protein
MMAFTRNKQMKHRSGRPASSRSREKHHSPIAISEGIGKAGEASSNLTRRKRRASPGASHSSYWRSSMCGEAAVQSRRELSP